MPGVLHFYPRSPRGERPDLFLLSAEWRDFYPRSPRGERPTAILAVCRSPQFLSTLPARGATDLQNKPGDAALISIHAPREGSDLNVDLFSVQRHSISIHAPREGSDSYHHRRLCQQHDFYPRSPRGERLAERCSSTRAFSFLSTLPARGATGQCFGFTVEQHLFLSTLPARGATFGRPPPIRRAGRFLSTLPARGATSYTGRWCNPAFHFYPRSPRGERPALLTTVSLPKHFYPRSPRGERPADSGHRERQDNNFYPRSPRGERRPLSGIFSPHRGYFYPRSPRGERPGRGTGGRTNHRISIHAPREGSDLQRHQESVVGLFDFYPRSPRGERPPAFCKLLTVRNFYPRSPRGERL